MQLVTHPTTALYLTALQTDLPQSLLISGAPGVGLMTIAKSIAGNRLASIIQPVDKKEQIDQTSGTITVELIRRLYDQTRAKQTKTQVIIIDDADRMSRGAQSAFLKLLEEPSQHTHFILTSHHPQQLLSTIRSRVQHTTIHPVLAAQTSEYIEHMNVTDPVKIRQLQFIGAGLPAELFRLTHDDEYFQAQAAITMDARDFLQTDAYKKLSIIQKYQSDRGRSLRLIDSALAIARRSLSTKPQQPLVRQLEQLLTIREHIDANYNVRLQLMQFVL